MKKVTVHTHDITGDQKTKVMYFLDREEQLKVAGYMMEGGSSARFWHCTKSRSHMTHADMIRNCSTMGDYGMLIDNDEGKYTCGILPSTGSVAVGRNSLVFLKKLVERLAHEPPNPTVVDVGYFGKDEED